MSFAGLFNTTCTIQVKTKTQDTTSRQMVETWATYTYQSGAQTAVKCRLDQATGGLVKSPDNKYVNATHILFMAYRTDIDEHNYRFVIGGNNYKILSVAQAGGTTHHTEFQLERVF